MSLQRFKKNLLNFILFKLLFLFSMHSGFAANASNTVKDKIESSKNIRLSEALCKIPYAKRQEVKNFLTHLSQKHHLNQDSLNKLFSNVYPEPKIIEAISKPYEEQPWYKYKINFISEERINNGVHFWKEHQDLLKKAEAKYGVPAEIIVAIIGVETSYGQKMGKYPVIQSLSTLAFDYPKRGPFFKGELEQFILLVHEDKLDPSIKGSYAGAIGMPQFMPSSYRQYAVDFNNRGQRDLIQSPADAIGSVANYFNKHGWTQGGAIAQKAKVQGTNYKTFLVSKQSNPKPDHSLASLKKVNVLPENSKAVKNNNELAALIELKAENNGKEHWLGMHNFYVITRYNHSAHYAMAVYQLSQKLKARMKS